MEPPQTKARPVLLYAVLEEGPVRLDVGGGHTGFDSLYEGLELGVYTALRTFNHNCFLDLEHHLRRTRSSMSRFGMGEELDTQVLRRALHEVCTAYPGEDMRVRIDVLAAPATALKVSSRELIALAPFTPPDPGKYRHGAGVMTTRALTRDDPLTKAAGFTAARKQVMAAFPDAEDCLLVDGHDVVLEGASSNFYAVVDGVLRTAGEGVLEGITRSIVLDLARHQGCKLRLEAVSLEELARATEAAISSSSRGLMPVTRIDGAKVGKGEPGPILGGLHRAYDEYVARTVRPAIEP